MVLIKGDKMNWFMTLLISVFLLSCARSPLKSPEEAIRKYKSTLEIQDDLSMESLVEVLKIHVEHLNKKPEKMMSFGALEIKSSDYAKSLDILITEITAQEPVDLSKLDNPIKKLCD